VPATSSTIPVTTTEIPIGAMPTTGTGPRPFASAAIVLAVLGAVFLSAAALARR
jgi:hypothetical protein